MVDYGLNNKVVLITGANNPQGIGATTALAFAREGARVALVYKKMNFPYDTDKTQVNGPDRYHQYLAGDCAAVAEELDKMGADYLVLESDIRDEESVAPLFDQIEARLGLVQVLVNNAATYAGNDTIFLLDPADMHAVYDTNIKGTLLMSQEYVRRFHRVSSGGRVIHVSTDAAQAFSGGIAYGSSKAAIEALTRSMAMELGGYGVTVNAVAPGPIQTGWIDADLAEAVVPQIPLGRLGLPQDIADAILFLASSKACWLTGQVIKISGGHAL